MLHGAKPGNGTTLTEADAQDAGGSYFEHILHGGQRSILAGWPGFETG